MKIYLKGRYENKMNIKEKYGDGALRHIKNRVTEVLRPIENSPE